MAGRVCEFCQHEITNGGNYIYPVPDGLLERQVLINEGVSACSDCTPSVRQAQHDQGLVTPVEKTRRMMA